MDVFVWKAFTTISYWYNLVNHFSSQYTVIQLTSVGSMPGSGLNEIVEF